MLYYSNLKYYNVKGYNVAMLQCYNSPILQCYNVTATVSGRVEKVEVQLRGESYNVTAGCPSKNPEVLRWQKYLGTIRP